MPQMGTPREQGSGAVQDVKCFVVQVPQKLLQVCSRGARGGGGRVSCKGNKAMLLLGRRGPNMRGLRLWGGGGDSGKENLE